MPSVGSTAPVAPPPALSAVQDAASALAPASVMIGLARAGMVAAPVAASVTNVPSDVSVSDAAFGTEQLSSPYAGLYDVLGRDVEGVLEPLDIRSEGMRLHERLRPEHALLGDQDNALAHLAYLWLLPSTADPLPERTLVRVVAALNAGCVVALRAGDMPAIEAARRAVLPLIDGGRA